MLGNQELQAEAQDKLSSHLEPDQEVAAVLGAGTLQCKMWVITPRACRQ